MENCKLRVTPLRRCLSLIVLVLFVFQTGVHAQARLVTVNFVNQSSHTVEVYWNDNGKNEVRYASLPPGAAYEQKTYPGHSWHFRSKKELIRQYEATGVALQEVLLEDPEAPAGIPEVGVAALEAPIQFRAPDLNAISQAVLAETNRYRVHEGLPPLQLSPQLNRAAQMHANDMVTAKFFSHTNPHDSTKRSLQQRMQLSGIKATNWAENIANAFGIQYVAGTPLLVGGRGVFRTNPRGPAIPPHSPKSFTAALVKQWMNSPAHRKNILSRNTFMGVGVSFYTDSNAGGITTGKAVQVFGTN